MKDRSQQTPHALYERLHRYAYEAREGDPAAVDRLRRFLQQHPELAGYLIDPVLENLGQAAHLLAQNNPADAEAIVADSVHWQKTMLAGNRCPVLQSLIEQLACQRLMVLYAERQARFQMQFDMGVHFAVRSYRMLMRQFQNGLALFARLARSGGSRRGRQGGVEEKMEHGPVVATVRLTALNGAVRDDLVSG